MHPALKFAKPLVKVGTTSVMNTALGGKLKSEDPYAMDSKYLRGIFGLSAPSPRPR